MTEENKDIEEMTRKDLEPMSDEELAEAYLSLSRVCGVFKGTLQKFTRSYDKLKQKDDVSQEKLEKAKQNSKEAEEEIANIEALHDIAKEEVERRDIDPYEYS